MADHHEFKQPRLVEIVQGRWNVTIRILAADGSEHEFIASADSALTDRSGIFFGTPAEYDEKVSQW